MNASDVVRRLHRYRAWSNEQLVLAARGLGDERLRRNFPIGQGSVWSSLVHLYGADRLWLDAFEGRARSPFPRDDDFEGLDALASAWADLNGRWLDYLGSLDDSHLFKPVALLDLRGRRCTLADSLDGHLQVCTHAAYTAAQVVNMLRQLGVEPLPNLMLVALSHAEGKVEVEPTAAGPSP
jgi:uncharacterized damage-inducible protein DinB